MKDFFIASFSWDILKNVKPYTCFMCHVSTTCFMIFYMETVSKITDTITKKLDFVCMNCSHCHSTEDILQKL